ncbi:hypothetical protein OS493_016345 [Desmophyllum pertusum]|uniref:Uncharacterized protein n=1 Tax=Desmophyllum pertusum TaxID=174260 RepID=A0A9X0D577_9CNID|nr:hypothetical protein OS493_016345 [Desmophyllum pertusum]
MEKLGKIQNSGRNILLVARHTAILSTFDSFMERKDEGPGGGGEGEGGGPGGPGGPTQSNSSSGSNSAPSSFGPPENERKP